MAISGIRGEQPGFDSDPSGAIARVGRLESSKAPAPASVDGAFSKAMRGLAREIDVGEAQVARASRPHDYDTSKLIALQVGIYRYTEAVDLASKVVDRATNAVRTVLQGGGH